MATIAVKPRLTKTPSMTKARARLTAPAWSLATARRRRKKMRPHDPLEAVVEAPGQFADRAADVLEQAGALGADRGPHLRRLGDPLDQLLGLLAGQQPAPDLVDQFAVHRLQQRSLDRLALQRPLHRLLDDRPLQHPRHRPLDRLALDRGDDRLLGGDFDGAVDPGRLADGADPAHADPEQPRRERQVAVLSVASSATRRWRSGAVFHAAASIRPVAELDRRSDSLPLLQALEQAVDQLRLGRRGSCAAPGRGRTTRPGRPRGTRARCRCAAATPSECVAAPAPPGRTRPRPPRPRPPCRISGGPSRARSAARRSSAGAAARAPRPSRAGRRPAADSPGLVSPLGIVQAPRSRFDQ